MKRLLALAALTVSLPALSMAQNKPPKIQIGINGSTLGLGAELTVGVHPMIEFRAAGNWFKLERSFDIDGVDYDASANWKSATFLLDLHPFKNALRLSGGLAYNGNKVEIAADPNISVEVGDTTYNSSDIGILSGLFDFKKAAPYLGFGFSGSGKIAFSFDLGVVVQGSPRVTYTGTTTLTGTAATVFNNAIDDETVNIQSELDDQQLLKYFPVVSFGLKYRFR